MSTQEFLLPDVGEGLEAGTIVQWLVQAGDTVKTDQIIVEVETDKAVVEIPSPVTGTLTVQGAEIGESLPVGSVLACFEVATESPTQKSKSEATPVSAVNSADANAANLHSTRPASSRVLASPATRKFARSQGVDLKLVTGSGSRGQITRADVEQFLNRGSDAPAISPTAPTPQRQHITQPTQLESRTESLTGLRKQIASNMQTAWRDIPHIFTFEEVDATALIDARTEINNELSASGAKISYLPFLVKACVLALKEHPRFNASLYMDDETVTYHGNCNIGIATATPEGLIVTVIQQAEQKTLLQIGAEINQLAELARQRRVSVDQIRGGTFTISNFGSYGGTLGTPIIRPPEVAIAGFGRIHEKVVPVNGEPAVRQILPIAVSTDHRLNDGEHLGGFVSSMSRFLENPIKMLGYI